MNIPILLLVALVCTSVTTETIFKVATFNTLFLFDPPHPRNLLPWTSKEHADIHLTNIANTIKYMNADLVNMVEVQSSDILQRVVDVSQLNYTVLLVPGKDTYTLQNVGLLSKIKPSVDIQRDEERQQYPIVEVQSKCGYKVPELSQSTGISKHYFTQFNISVGDQFVPLVVFGLHFISVPTKESACSQREGQALVARNILRRIKAAVNESEFIVMGDFNDYDNLISDYSNNVPTSQTFDILRDKDNLNLTNVLHYVPKDELYTHWWDKNSNGVIDHHMGELSVLDHILVSPKLAEAIQTVKIVHDLYPNGNLNFSDHWPVMVTFDLDKMFPKDEPKEPKEPKDKPKEDNWRMKATFAIIAVCLIVVIVSTMGVCALYYRIKRRNEHIRLEEVQQQELEEVTEREFFDE